MRRTRSEQTKEDIFHSTSIFFAQSMISGKTKTFTIVLRHVTSSPLKKCLEQLLYENLSVKIKLNIEINAVSSIFLKQLFCTEKSQSFFAVNALQCSNDNVKMAVR
jgi:hypothetical protein